jgi:hypothetical protein
MFTNILVISILEQFPMHNLVSKASISLGAAATSEDENRKTMLCLSYALYNSYVK